MRTTFLLLLALLPDPSRAATPEPTSAPPRVLSWVAPVYPPAALQAQATPTVEVLVKIDRRGAVVEASSVSWFPLGLSEASEAAAKQWRFAPGSLPLRTADLAFSFSADRTEAAWTRPAEWIDPYHLRIWGAVARKSPPSCPLEGVKYTLTVPPPRVVSWVAAQYTEVARKARLQGTVKTIAEIDSNGRVVWACSSRKLPYGLDKASEEALKRWRFAADPRPVRWIELEVDFGVNDTEERSRPAELVAPYHMRVWADVQVDVVIYSETGMVFPSEVGIEPPGC